MCSVKIEIYLKVEFKFARVGLALTIIKLNTANCNWACCCR